MKEILQGQLSNKGKLRLSIGLPQSPFIEIGKDIQRRSESVTKIFKIIAEQTAIIFRKKDLVIEENKNWVIKETGISVDMEMFDLHLLNLYSNYTTGEFINLSHEQLVEDLILFADSLANRNKIILRGVHKKKQAKKTPKIELKELLQIWTNPKSHYNQIIEFLKEESPSIGSPFIRTIEEKIQWQRFKNHIQYLCAFTRCCIDKGYIENKYTSKQLGEILSNTFNISFDTTPLKSIGSKLFPQNYLDPFNNL